MLTNILEFVGVPQILSFWGGSTAQQLELLHDPNPAGTYLHRGWSSACEKSRDVEGILVPFSKMNDETI